MTRRSVTILAALGLVTAVLIGCEARPPARPSAKNLIVINVDTLRADHLGCYGYARDTSPFIDSLAAEGVRFNEARTNSAFTRESVAALLTGRLPSRSGNMGWEAKPPASDHNLGRIFQRAGYATGFFSATTMLTDPHFTQGFQTVHQLTEQWGASGLGPELSTAAVRFARSAAVRPFMMYLHYLDPHGPYEPSEVHYRKFAPTPLAAPLSLYTNVRPRLPELLAEGFGPGEARFDDLVARYDAEIADTDAAIAELFAGLKPLGVLDHTIVILTADHGEEFLEHGFVEHAWTLYDEVLRVPLIFWPATALGKLQGQQRAASVDVLPTVLEIMEIAERPPELDGRSLFADEDRPFIGELVIEERSVLRTVINGRWKYIAAQKWLPPAARPSAAQAAIDAAALRCTTSSTIWQPIPASSATSWPPLLHRSSCCARNSRRYWRRVENGRRLRESPARARRRPTCNVFGRSATSSETLPASQTPKHANLRALRIEPLGRQHRPLLKRFRNHQAPLGEYLKR